MRLLLSCLLVPVFLTATFAAQRVDITIDASAKGKPVARSLLAGTCLPVWNRTGVYQEISSGLSAAGFSLFRFPNGSLSNDYHWNGTGNYTSDGLWESDSLTWTSGFMSKTRFRGTSKNNYGFEGYSAITDGDTATQWWSDNQVTGSASTFYLELAMTQVVDSAVTIWGDRRGVNFSIDFWRAMTAPYPGPHAYAQDLWQRRDSAQGNTLRVYGAKLESDLPTRFVRVVDNTAVIRRRLGFPYAQELIACLTASRSAVVFNLRMGAPSRLVIYDTRGRIVHRSSPLNVATTEYLWHPQGNSAPSGTYLVTLSGRSFKAGSKFVLTQ